MRIGECRPGFRGPIAAMMVVLAAAGPGCSDLEGNSRRVRPGMTVAEADAVLGAGREVAADQLPEVFRETFLKETQGEGVSYRTWTEEKTSVHAAFKNGKLVYGPAVWKTGSMSVDIKDGKITKSQ